MKTALKVGIITQARMTSTRLPGKILLKAGDVPLLKYHLERLKKSGLTTYIATTENKTDDVVEQFAKQEGIKFSRGSESNVLSRFYNCAVQNNLDIIIRVTSDCPLIDGALIEQGLDKYLELGDENLYLSNALQRTFPRGFDFEIFSFKLLKEAFEQADLELEKEHVTPYINRNRSGKVDFFHFVQETDKSNFRITVDTQEDFDLVKILIEEYKADKMNYQEITRVLDLNPSLVRINAHIEQKKS